MKKRIKRAVRKQCASFSGSTGSNGCLYELDGELSCRYFRDEGAHWRYNRCIYFENAVLPDDPGLESEYWAEITRITGEEKAAEGNGAKNVRKCARCNNSFRRRSNRQKYCDSCRHKARKTTSRDRQQRRRQKAS